MDSKLQGVTHFFQKLFKSLDDVPGGGFVSLWCLPSKESVHLPANDLPWIAENALSCDTEENEDVYFGVGLRDKDLGPHRRGGKADVIAMPGLWVDVDIAGPGHASTKLPPTFSEAADIIEAAVLAPTMVVDSGGGLHAYWVFDRPFVTPDAASRAWFEDLCARLQRRLRSAAQARGWHLDETFDCTRILRVPGTTNRKVPELPRRCYLVEADGPIYPIEDIAKELGLVAPSSASPAPAHAEERKARVATETDADLQSRVRERLKTLKRPHSRDIMKPVLRGDAFAAPGERDRVLQQIASILAAVEPEADPATLAEILRPSLEDMAAQAPEAPTVEDAADKVARAQDDLRTKKAAEAHRDAGIRDALSRHANRNRPSPTVAEQNFTETELAEIAVSQSCGAKELEHRLIVQHGTAFFVMGRDGRYKEPITRDALAVSLPRDLARYPVNFWVTKRDGESRRARIDEILERHAIVARRLVSSLVLQSSYYDDASETFFEAVCPLQPLEPKENPLIQEWLERLGGSERERLLDWIATLTFLDRQTAAVYLSGPPNVGKTLLATGLARLWTTGGPTEMARVMDTAFNSCLTRCPLIFADEYLPARQQNSAAYRQMIASDRRTLSRKYLPSSELLGCVRLMFAANNERLLSFKENLSDEDLRAISSRILHVDTSRAAGFLADLGGREATDGWVDRDEIAAHALWLRDNRKVKAPADGRFLVEGTATRVHRQLATQGPVSSQVVEWLAQFLNAPAPARQMITGRKVVVGDGQLLVNTAALIEFWDAFVKTGHKHSTTILGTALGNLSVGEVRRNQARYHVLNVDLIYDWADRNQIGDVEQMRALVNTPLGSASPKESDATEHEALVSKRAA